MPTWFWIFPSLVKDGIELVVFELQLGSETFVLATKLLCDARMMPSLATGSFKGRDETS